jgi:hypothetical protein
MPVSLGPGKPAYCPTVSELAERKVLPQLYPLLQVKRQRKLIWEEWFSFLADNSCRRIRISDYPGALPDF